MELEYFEEKKSKFYSICVKVENKQQVKDFAAKLWLEHKKARHICYGYVFYENQIQYAGCDDNGEPKHTAGKPIRDLLIKTKSKNLAIFVVRYFGGIKLGAGGISRAYLKSAMIALKKFNGE